jgi:hypothetical protein
MYLGHTLFYRYSIQGITGEGPGFPAMQAICAGSPPDRDAGITQAYSFVTIPANCLYVCLDELVRNPG